MLSFVKRGLPLRRLTGGSSTTCQLSRFIKRNEVIIVGQSGAGWGSIALEQNPTDLNREGFPSGANSEFTLRAGQGGQHAWSSLCRRICGSGWFERLKVECLAMRPRNGSASRSASAVRFVKEWRENGATKAKRLGGDQRSQRIEEHHEAIMSAIEAKPDMTLVEIAEMLESEQGLRLRRVRFGVFSTVTA